MSTYFKSIFILISLFLSHNSYTQSPYKIIPPCSLCSQQEAKLLKDDSIDTEYTQLLRSTNQTFDEFNDDESINNWKLIKKQRPHKLKINYKDSFNVYFEKLSIIRQIVETYGHTIDVHISPKLMTLYLYTPKVNGLSRRDFKIALDITRAMTEHPLTGSATNKKDIKGTYINFNDTKIILFFKAPLWDFQLWGGRHLTRTIPCNSFAQAMNIIEAIKIETLETELQEISYSQESLTIILQRYNGKSVYKETIDTAITIEKIIQETLKMQNL